MFGSFSRPRGKARDEAEKPFWISYADLMTALMVLFLVVMSVALLTVEHKETAQEKERNIYLAQVASCMEEIKSSVGRHPDMNIVISEDQAVVDFGVKARFPLKVYQLTPEQERSLRAFVPELSELAKGVKCKELLKRVVVEGFTDQTGTYLGNLKLSLQRSQSVVCALFSTPSPGEVSMSQVDREEIQRRFLVEGFSYNSAKDTADASRRVELRLELYKLGERHPAVGMIDNLPLGQCQQLQ